MEQQTQYDFISLNKREFMSLAWQHNDRAAAIHHMPDGMHEFVADDGSTMALWDDVSEFGIIAAEFTYCPIQPELDTCLVDEWAKLDMCKVQASIHA